MSLVIDKKYTGTQIKNIRSNLDITQKEFSCMTSINANRISLFERGKTMPKLEELIIICNVFNKVLDDMVSYKFK